MNSVTIKEAQCALGVGQTKIYDLLNRGLLEGIKIGRATRITSRSIEAFIQGHRYDFRAKVARGHSKDAVHQNDLKPADGVTRELLIDLSSAVYALTAEIRMMRSGGAK